MFKNTTFLDFIENSTINFDAANSSVFNFLSNIKIPNLKQHHHTVFNRQAIIQLLIFVKLTGVKSIGAFINGDLGQLLPFKKDVFYTIKNNPLVNWRGGLLKQAFKMLVVAENTVHKYNSSPDKLACLIADDSDIVKTGKVTELIGKIFSHKKPIQYKLGFKSLNLAIWTGLSLFQLDMSFHIELGKKKNQGMKPLELKQRFSKQRASSSFGFKRAEESKKSKIDILCQMVKRVMGKGLTVHYLLLDSWFFCEKVIKLSKQVEVDLLTRPKFNNWLYGYKNKRYTMKQLSRKFRYLKDRKYHKKLNLYYVSLEVIFKGHPLKLFLFKEKKRGAKWQALISTDLKLDAIRAYKVYKNRWSIEVSYKELKQNLRYGKCQSTDFDAQIADATLTLMSYNFLSKQKSINEHESIGGLFRAVSKSWLSPTLMQEFWKQTYALIKDIADVLEIAVDKLLEICLTQNTFVAKIEKFSAKFTTET